MKFANLVEICLWLHLAVKGLRGFCGEHINGGVYNWIEKALRSKLYCLQMGRGNKWGSLSAVVRQSENHAS